MIIKFPPPGATKVELGVHLQSNNFQEANKANQQLLGNLGERKTQPLERADNKTEFVNHFQGKLSFEAPDLVIINFCHLSKASTSE